MTIILPTGVKQNSAYDPASNNFMIEPKWKFKSVDEDCVNQIAETFNLPRTIARIMSLRGIYSRDDSKEFFYPDIHQLHNPFLMIDMEFHH